MEVFDALLNRRSVRRYKPELPAREELEKIAEAGLYAASGKGMQTVRIVIVTNPELIAKLRADSRFRRLPVYALTADTEVRGDERTSLLTGILFKPVTYNKLMDVFAAQC